MIFSLLERRQVLASRTVGSFCEYFLQCGQRGCECLCGDRSQSPCQPGFIYGANLVEQNQTLSTCVSHADPKRRFTGRRGHGGNDDCAQMIVHLGRRYHYARACLLDFAPGGRIKIHQPDFSTRHQTSSESSALPNSPITSSSSPVSAIRRAASAQPVRAGLAGRRSTSEPSSIVISTPPFVSRPS